MNKILKEKISEAFGSVLPISAIVLVLSTLLVPMSLGTVVMFVVGAALLIVGMGFFTLGADIAMMPMGEGMGIQFTKVNKLWLVVIACFLMGLIITIAEPDLQVLANQIPSVPNMTLIFTVAVGVGLFLVVALLRILFKLSLNKMLIGFYILVFALSIIVPDNFVAVAFDSGGVTTGPITVPFILALGTGLASIRSDKDSQDDSFGLVALCSVGPILAVMMLGIVYNPQNAHYERVVIPEVETMRDVLREFARQLPHYTWEVLLALLPIVVFFAVFQLVTRRYRHRQLGRMMIGVVYTIIGLVLFLTGVNVGFIPVGSLLGAELGGSAYKWLLIPLGMLIGYFLVAAEPAVHVLTKQVEEISGGAIPERAMNICLAIGVCASVGLAMLRVVSGLSIYWLIIPGYLVALLLTFRTPKIFTGIAFDSGGVASGPMTSTFLLPFAMGACEAAGGNVLTDAFGIVAMVAMTPLIAVQLMGLIYKKKMAEAVAVDDVDTALDDADILIDTDDDDDVLIEENEEVAGNA